MLTERIEKLRQEYTGQHVVVDSEQAELARFAGKPAQVKTINFNGRALVQFEGADRSWYDIELDHLKVVDQPEPEHAETADQPAPAEKPAAKRVEAAAEPKAKEKLSRLELARLEKEAAKPGGDTGPAENPSQ